MWKNILRNTQATDDNIIWRIRFAKATDTLRIYRVSQEEWTKLRESVPYVKIY